MLRILGLFLTVVLLPSAVAWGAQGSSAPTVVDPSTHVDHPISSVEPQDCVGFADALLVERRIVDRDRDLIAAVNNANAANSTAPASTTNLSPASGAQPSTSDLQQDLNILHQRELEFNRCAASNASPNVTPDPLPDGCSSEQLIHFEMNHDGEPEREIPIWHLPQSAAFFYESGMTIDADGAPNAYHPDNTGLDDLSNAGAPGHWQGIAKDTSGEPYVQGPNDPFPGYYVSVTALADRTKAVNDPTRYVDASKIPFIVLPGGLARQLYARPGDFAAVMNLNNGKSSPAIFGDVGPSDRIGEGSVALAENLGIRSDARNGGSRRGIVYLVFPGSGDGQPRTTDEINAETEKLVQAWGGSSQLTACTVRPTFRPLAGNRNPN